jgi:hypothetical protein
MQKTKIVGIASDTNEFQPFTIIDRKSSNMVKSLVIQDFEILPGERKDLSLTIARLPTHTEIQSYPYGNSIACLCIPRGEGRPGIVAYEQLAWRRSEWDRISPAHDPQRLLDA